MISAIREMGYAGPLVAEMIPNYPHFGKVKIGNASRAMDAIMAGGEEEAG